MNPQEFCREKGYTSTILLTYDFDPLFFERLVLRNLWAGETGDVVVLADSHRIVECSVRWLGQLRNLGRRYQLVPAATPGAFHPKMILRIGPDGGAVWLGSGNLTSGGWGGNRELCSAWSFGPSKKDLGAWVGPLLEQIATWCPSRLQHDVIRRAGDIAWVQAAAESSGEHTGMLLTSAGNRTLASQLRQRWAGRRFKEARIITGSTDENGAMLRWLHDELGVRRALVIVDENRSSFLAKKIAALPIKVKAKHLPDSAPVHAKFFWLEGPDGAAAVVGSANCSAAAWLLEPDSGGNVEAVVAYDRAKASYFKHVLELFDSDKLMPVRLKTKGAATQREGRAATAPLLAEVLWDEPSGEIRISFQDGIESISKVSVELVGETVAMRPLNRLGVTWVAEVPQTFDAPETVFIDLQIQLRDGALHHVRHWVNDLAELRHAAGGRRISETLGALAKRQTPTEQQRIISGLQRIGLALLSEPQSFPDPLTSLHHAHEQKTEGQKDIGWESIDPEDFVRSIEDISVPTRYLETRLANAGVSLLGVMRALFGARTLADSENAEDSEDREEVEEGGDVERSVRGSTTGARLAAPEDRYINRLNNHMDAFLSNLSSQEFASQCTATQLIQAAAYPVAVATLGLRGSWVDEETANKWVQRVFDALFVNRLAESGLLATVRTRYTEEGRNVDFLRVVGDGTLWLALLASLGTINSEEQNAGFRKAFALRSIYRSRELIASSKAGRMGILLARLDEQAAKAVMKGAPKAAKLLDKLEKELRRNWDVLLRKQESARSFYDVEDLLWNPKAGWAEVWEASPWGENFEAYLHIRADVKRVGGKFFLNVTKIAADDGKLEHLFNEMRNLK